MGNVNTVILVLASTVAKQSQLRLPARPVGLRLALTWYLDVYAVHLSTLCSARVSSTEQLKHIGSVCKSNFLHLSHPSSHSMGRQSKNMAMWPPTS